MMTNGPERLKLRRRPATLAAPSSPILPGSLVRQRW